MDGQPNSRAPKRLDFLGMRFHDVTMQEAVGWIDACIQSGRATQFVQYECSLLRLLSQ